MEGENRKNRKAKEMGTGNAKLAKKEKKCKAERNNFAIQLPTKRCVEVLKRVALSQKSTERGRKTIKCTKSARASRGPPTLPENPSKP